jgi:PAS domain S-box-containing protein
VHPRTTSRLRIAPYPAVALAALSLALSTRAAGSDRPPLPVLVLHSYHAGFTWTDLEMKGIRDELRAHHPEIDLQVEYLDAKRHPDPAVTALFADLLAVKLHGIAFPVVIATDNAALEFALDVRPVLFPGAPVVFCGVNGPPEAAIRGRGRVTGVEERWDPGGTLRAIARMQPSVRDVLVVHDQTESGRGTRAEVEAIIPSFQDRLRFWFLRPQSLDATLREVETLPDSWAVLLMGYNVDFDGKLIDSADTGPLLAGHSRVAVYTMDQTRFGGGVVGGDLLSGEQQGRIAAQLAGRILDGTPVEAIPIVREPVALPRFDYAALKRFGISPGDLPRGSEVVHTPTSFYEKYRYRIWGLVAFGAAWMGLSAALAVYVLSRRRLERERARAVEALRGSEERFRALIENATDIITVEDAGGQTLFWSPSAVETLGWTGAEMQGRSMLDLAHADDHAPAERAMEALRGKEGATARVTVRVRHKDGSWRTLEIFARNRLGDPAVQGIVVNGRDLTEQRLLEEQVQQSQKLESIGRLAGGVAHDFNNLLTVILSGAESLKHEMGRDPRGDREIAEEIASAGTRARDLTRQLLAFARRQVISPVPLDLNDVLRQSHRLLERTLGEDVELTARLEPGLWPVRCDPGQIQQVILNLAVNARDAMPNGGRLTIETANVDLDDCMAALHDSAPAGPHVRLAVRDSGHGMSPEVRAHVFEPFFTTKPVGKGTGLGLATVYGIVKQNDGHILLETGPGQGTTFEILLPRTSEAELAQRPPSCPSAHRSSGTETILVVEDDAQVRDVTVRAVRSAGYRVLVASGGPDALEVAARETSLRLLITDVVMPGMNGRDVAEALRGRRPGLRVLYVSGYTQDAIAERGVLQENVDFLQKPFTAASLLERVRAALDA